MKNDSVLYYTENNGYTTFQVPYSGLYQIECWGAQGGSSKYPGGKGGYSKGVIELVKGEILHIYVGSTTSSSSGGWNGGGGVHNNRSCERGGGGGTDVRIGGTTLNHRIIVAGGGGGGNDNSAGAIGGGLSGSKQISSYNISYDAHGGSQTSGGKAGGSSWKNTPGTFGRGGTGQGDHGSGGGGGWYGGGGGLHHGGAGGSGYVLTNTSYRPNGYYHSSNSFYFLNETMRDGSQVQPLPSSTLVTSTQVGNSGNGAVRIAFLNSWVFLPNYKHYVIMQNNKFYIPTLKYYNANTRFFNPVSKDYIKDIGNRSNFLSNIDYLSTLLKAFTGEEFRPLNKFENFNILAVHLHIDDAPLEWIQAPLKLKFNYNISDHISKLSFVKLKDPLNYKKNIKDFYLEFKNISTEKIFMESDNCFYGDYQKIIDNYNTQHSEAIANDKLLPIDFEIHNFRIYINENIDKAYNKMTINILSKRNKALNMSKKDDYDIMYLNNEQCFIKFNKDISKVYINKTSLFSDDYIRTLDTF